MEKMFFTTLEVADFLGLSEKTLRNYSSRHELYRSSCPGIWYKAHVALLEKCRAGFLTEDEALLKWREEISRIRKECGF